MRRKKRSYHTKAVPTPAKHANTYYATLDKNNSRRAWRKYNKCFNIKRTTHTRKPTTPEQSANENKQSRPLALVIRILGGAYITRIPRTRVSSAPGARAITALLSENEFTSDEQISNT